MGVFIAITRHSLLIRCTQVLSGLYDTQIVPLTAETDKTFIPRISSPERFHGRFCAHALSSLGLCECRIQASQQKMLITVRIWCLISFHTILMHPLPRKLTASSAPRVRASSESKAILTLGEKGGLALHDSARNINSGLSFTFSLRQLMSHLVSQSFP